MRGSPRRFRWLALLPLALGAIAAPAAPMPEGEGDSDAPPAVTSPWRTWQFNAPPERIRAELSALFKEDGLSLKEEDRKAGTFVTDLVEFDEKKFGVELSIPPPKAGPKYPWFQTNDMKSGRFGIEGKIHPVHGAEVRVDLRALLEIRGMDQKIRSMRWIPRYSNGAVESLYFTRLSMRLLPAATGESTRR